MDYIEKILSKLELLSNNLEKVYDEVLRTLYKNDITKVTSKKILNEDDSFFLNLGKDLEYIKLIRDKIVVTEKVLKSNLIEINDLYKKYKLSGDIK